MLLALEARLRESARIPTLKIRYTRVFGWYIEVTRSQLSKVPSSWRRKQTVAVGERYTNERLDQLAADIETAEDRALSREAELFRGLVAAVDRASDRIRALARTLGGWDVASALAEVAHVEDYAKPEVDDEALLDIVEGRHPVVEQHAARGRFVPNDTRLDVAEGRLFLVTGPNMAGKSTLMRQVALIVLLAQMGSYVPARRARVGIVDRLLSRVGASDNLARGESTFMVEMRETASILQHATKRSLVILDEIGRGTSTYDGLAIAWAVAEHLHDVIGCRALFATHYHELTELSKTAEHIVNVSVSAREHAGGVVFLHTLVQGPASRSYGVAVAKLAGLPESVVARAKALLGTFEGQGGALGGSGGVSAKGRRQTAQLGLFEPAPTDAERTAITTLRAVDVDRLTPLEAIGLLAKLRNSLLPKDQG
jgi:DNA mismatch repair protein MutS